MVKGTKMNRGGRKSYPNTVEPQKKFQRGVELNSGKFFFFFLPSQSCLPVSINNGISFSIDHVDKVP